MFKFIQAILFMGLLLAVIFLGNRILDEADTDFAGRDQLARQKAVIAENVTELQKVTMEKADELKKMYKSVKNAEFKAPVSDVPQKSEDVSLVDNVGRDLNNKKLKSGDDSTSDIASKETKFQENINITRKMIDPEKEPGLVTGQNRENATNNLTVAANSENGDPASKNAARSAQLESMDKEDLELTRQILAYNSKNKETTYKTSSMGERINADEAQGARDQMSTDLDNMAAIMDLYSKAAAVLDLK